MFSTRIQLGRGLNRWFTKLGRGIGRRRATVKGRPDREPPRTEGERALHQAMGWTDDAWGEEERADALRGLL